MANKSTKIDVEALKHAQQVGRSLPHLAQLFAVKARKLRSHPITLFLETKAKSISDEQANLRYLFILRLITMRAQDEQVSRISAADAADALAMSSLISGSMSKQKQLLKEAMKDAKEEFDT
ncbi:MAG: hypothetical protein ACTSSM_14970 [Promethearchaeota archaeon]